MLVTPDSEVFAFEIPMLRRYFIYFCFVFMVLKSLSIISFLLQLAGELERLMSLGEVCDADEVSQLRVKVSGLKTTKQELDKRIAVLVEQKRESGEKIISLLADNSKMVSECDLLEANL